MATQRARRLPGGCCDGGMGVLILGSDDWIRADPTLGGKGGTDDLRQLLELDLTGVGIAQHCLEVVTALEQGPRQQQLGFQQVLTGDLTPMGAAIGIQSLGTERQQMQGTRQAMEIAA